MQARPKVDFHFHLEEGPYSTNWLERTARAIVNMDAYRMEHGGKSEWTAERHTMAWAAQLSDRLQRRIHRGFFDLEWLKLYFERGRQRGVQHFGIVDHLYRFDEFRPYYERHIRLDDTKLGRLQRYWLDRVAIGSIEPFVKVVREAQGAGYPVSLGAEADYFPGGMDELGELLNRYDFDYVIGSNHFVEGWGFDNPEVQERFQEQDLVELYQKGFDYVKDAANSGLFDIIAHLDNLKVFNYRPDESLLLPMYEEVAKTLKQADVATEVNTGLAYRYPVKEACPSPSFLKVLHKHGVPLTLSSDSHFPDDLGTLLDEAIELLMEIGYKEVVYFKERKRLSFDLNQG